MANLPEHIDDSEGQDSALTRDDVTLGSWNEFVRRARIGQKRKLACLILSSYANNDGSAVHCGVNRLALDFEGGESTARRFLAWVRSVGLVRIAVKGNHRTGRADDYQLTIRPDTLDLITVPDPEEYKGMIATLAEKNRQRNKDAYQRSLKRSAESYDAERAEQGASALIQSERQNGFQRSLSDDSALTLTERPPPMVLTSPISTSHEAADVRTDLAVPRATHPEDRIVSARSLESTPKRRPTPTGIGVCVICAETGQFTIAADDMAGSYCATHLAIAA